MKTVETRRVIHADPMAVWSALTNPARLLAGGLGLLRLEGRIAQGEKIRLESATAPGRVFTLTVAEATAPRMVWYSGIKAIFNGTRTFTVTPHPQGTDFHMVEVYKGLMLGLIWRSMPDMQPGFDQFADGLKRLVEGKK